MIQDLEFGIVFLAALLLALLSLYTIEKCRRDALDHLSDKERFLFEGKSEIHGIASNVGAVFSVTYFFGATFIYSRIYRGSFIVAATIVFGTLFWLLPFLIQRFTELTPGRPHLESRGNLLLDFLAARLPRQDLAIQHWLLIAFYFGLLVEELAVSRLILATLFPVQPGMTTLMLSTICFVLMAYLYFGGFRAVLISDYEQLKVIVPFTLVLAVLIFRDYASPSQPFSLSLPGPAESPGFAFSIIFGLAWFSSGVDFFSRLNLTNTNEPLLSCRKRVARLSIVGLYVLLAIGILFGDYLVVHLPQLTTPTSYTQSAMKVFLFSGSPVIVVIFLVGMFCMIFTTLDTLLMSLLQIGHYGEFKFFRRRNVLRIMLLSLIFSTLIEFDSVSAIGIFIGSLVVIIFVGILLAMLPCKSILRPRSYWFLLVAAALSCIIFAANYAYFKLHFDRHFLIPGLVLACILACYLVDHVIGTLKGSRKDG